MISPQVRRLEIHHLWEEQEIEQSSKVLPKKVTVQKINKGQSIQLE